jgi:DNA-binding response OmpR family regulator
MRVLIADDNRDAASMLAAILFDEGHQVECVYNGAEVLPAIRQSRPDAVVLDIKMPGQSGYDVARAIHERYGEARPLLIAVSGHYKKGSDQVLARVVGFDHFFPKPCDPNALVSLLSGR